MATWGEGDILYSYWIYFMINLVYQHIYIYQQHNCKIKWCLAFSLFLSTRNHVIFSGHIFMTKIIKTEPYLCRLWHRNPRIYNGGIWMSSFLNEVSIKMRQSLYCNNWKQTSVCLCFAGSLKLNYINFLHKINLYCKSCLVLLLQLIECNVWSLLRY